MNCFRDHRKLALVLCTLLALTSACRKAERDSSYTDHPRLTPKVVLRDVTFHSASLNRDMPYRVVMPASIPRGVKFPVVYLLHGANGSFRDWSNETDVARFAGRGLILVMPDGDESWYTNSAEHPRDRYEDYITQDLLADVEARFPAATRRESRTIMGVSMGGFGAVKLALRHPDLYAFAGGLSSALDAAVRSQSHASASIGTIARSSDPWTAQAAATTILSCWPVRPIPRRCPTSF